MYKYVIWVVRVLLAVLVGFELAGQAGYFPMIDGRIWPGLLFMSVVSWAALEVADGWMRRQGLPRPPALAVLVGLGVVYMDAFGNIAGWYASVQRFDVLVHAASGLAVTAMLFYVVRDVAKDNNMNAGPRVWGYVAWASMVVLAVLFEAGEWAADVVFDLSFWLGSARDTMVDLLSAMVGGAVGLLSIWKFHYSSNKRVVD